MARHRLRARLQRGPASTTSSCRSGSSRNRSPTTCRSSTGTELVPARGCADRAGEAVDAPRAVGSGPDLRESAQVYLLDGVPFGTCAALICGCPAATAPQPPARARCCWSASNPATSSPSSLSPAGDHWAGTAAACPSAWSESGELFVAFYLGSDVESAAVAYDAAAHHLACCRVLGRVDLRPAPRSTSRAP